MSSMDRVGLDIASYYIEFVLSGLVHATAVKGFKYLEVDANILNTTST